MQQEAAEVQVANISPGQGDIRWHSLFENRQEGFAYCRIVYEDNQPQDLIHLAVNPAFETLTGLKDVVGKKLTEVIPGIRASNPELFEVYSRVARSGQQERFEQYLAPLGIWLKISVYSPEGGGSIVIIFDNITEHKLTERALRESEARLNFAMESIHAGAWELDLLDHTTRRTLLHDRIFGYQTLLPLWTREMFLEHLLPEDRPKVERSFREAAAAQSDWSIECRILRADGEVRWIWVAGSHVRAMEGKPVRMAGIVKDITDQKHMADMVLRTQRLESLSTMASGVAHEINNILTPIILSSDLLRGVQESAARESLIASIEKHAQRGADMVNQVFTFARGSKGERTALQLHSLIDNMETIMRGTFPKTISITSSVPLDLWPVKGESTQLHQVLLNLCINARDAMPNGGSLGISAENKRIDQSLAARLPDAKAGDYAIVSITDTGTGIPSEYIDRIFDPFFTLKEFGQGTGLGLSVVSGIARSHDGFVTVESEEGCGSTFRLFLPRETGGKPEQRHLEPMKMPQGGGETILVVDDESFIAKVTSLSLKQNGYNVLTASDGASAIALFRERANQIEIVITDVMMPEMDGVSLTRALKEINPRVKIIASTGHATKENQSELKALGVNVIMGKPYTINQLLTVLHEAIHSEHA